MNDHRPVGHNFWIGRDRVEHGWNLIGRCKCGHEVIARTYDDLHSLINDHFDDRRRLAQLEQEEQTR
jgi:hypothetical protein